MSRNNYYDKTSKEKDIRMGKNIYNTYCQILNDISNYLYAEIIFNDNMNNLSDLFEHIAEMKTQHFGILGDALVQLGINPNIRAQIRTNRINMDNKEGCYTAVSAEKCLNERKNIESSLIENYNNMCRMLENQRLIDTFKYLSESTEYILNALQNFEI